MARQVFIGMWVAALAAVFGIVPGSPAAAVSIDASTVTVAPGGVGQLVVSLRTMGDEVVATENRLEFAPPVRIAARANGRPDCAVNPGIAKNGTDFRFAPTGCVGTACSAVRAIVIAFDNSDPIADGSVLYTCRVTVDAAASAGDHTVRNVDRGASDAVGRFLAASGRHGTVQVRTATLAIEIEDVEAVAGEDATVAVRLRTSGTATVATQNTIHFAPPLRIAARATGGPDCTVNPAIDKSGTSFRFAPTGCTGQACTAVRAIVIAFDNVTPIPNGALLYTCRLQIEPSAAPEDHVLVNDDAAGSDAQGGLLPAIGTDGTVTVIVDDAPVVIDLGEVRAVAGQLATVGAHLTSTADAPAIAGTQNEIVFQPPLAIAATRAGLPACTVNPAIDKAGTSFIFLPPDCTPGRDCTAVRAFVLAFDNNTPIPPGSLLYRCGVNVASNANLGTHPLHARNAVASDPDGNEVRARGRRGAVEVICAGDCNGDGQVAIFELLRGVNILLGYQELDVCPVFDADDSTDVSISEIVQAASSALRGCVFADAAQP